MRVFGGCVIFVGLNVWLSDWGVCVIDFGWWVGCGYVSECFISFEDWIWVWVFRWERVIRCLEFVVEWKW